MGNFSSSVSMETREPVGVANIVSDSDILLNLRVTIGGEVTGLSLCWGEGAGAGLSLCWGEGDGEELGWDGDIVSDFDSSIVARRVRKERRVTGIDDDGECEEEDVSCSSGLRWGLTKFGDDAGETSGSSNWLLPYNTTIVTIISRLFPHTQFITVRRLCNNVGPISGTRRNT